MRTLSKFGDKLTYANVMSTLGVFLALAGGTFAVAAALKKNSVKAKQIAPNAVGSSEIKPDAVTGSEVNEATLGEVPTRSAANATNAQNAQNAPMRRTRLTHQCENATQTRRTRRTRRTRNADTVGGNTVREINYTANAGTGPQTILDLGGVQLVAGCAAPRIPNLIATTSKQDSSVYVSGIEGEDANDTAQVRDIDSGDLSDGDFDVGDTLRPRHQHR